MNNEFVDTNIILYAYDITAGDRHSKARKLVGELGRSRRGVLSIQVLQEFYVNVTRKIERTLPVPDAQERLGILSRWQIHSPLPHDVLAATQLADQHQLSFWDSMILRSAAEMGCRTLWSEDLNAGQEIAGVRIQNPFR